MASSTHGALGAAPRAQSPLDVSLPAHELSGPAGAPVVVALGGISASRHVTATRDDPSPGWWQGVAGPRAALDTTRFRLLGIDWLDGGRDAHGAPLRTVTTADQADALARTLDRLDVPRVHAVVGASYGGMVALAFAARHPRRLSRLVVVSAAHYSHPMSTALRTIQRRIVELGLRSGRPAEGLALARGLAMTTYRTAREFAERFGPGSDAEREGGALAVEGYLAHHGRRFAERFAPHRFLALSLSCDLHRVDPSAVAAPATLVAAQGDTLVPLEQMEALCRALRGPRRLLHLPSIVGHDAFLCEPAAMSRILDTALSGDPFP